MSDFFTGGRRLMIATSAVGALGTGATAFGYAKHPEAAAASWLLAFTFWTGLAAASLLLVAAFNAAGARWVTLVRRQLEHHAAALVVCAAAFVPLALRQPLEASSGGAVLFAVFLSTWLLLERFEAHREHARRISSVALVFLLLAMTAAGSQWLPAPGLHWLFGSLVSASALLTLAVVVPVDRNLAAAKVSSEHAASLALLMLCGSCLWAWSAFSQLLIISEARLPAELPWLAARTSPAWLPVTLLLVIGRFVLPCVTLLSHALRRDRKFLTALSVWLLTMQFVDCFWLLVPARREPAIQWTDATAFLGLGALCFAFVLFRMRGRPALPVDDPALEESIQYRQPS